MSVCQSLAVLYQTAEYVMAATPLVSMYCYGDGGCLRYSPDTNIRLCKFPVVLLFQFEFVFLYVTLSCQPMYPVVVLVMLSPTLYTFLSTLSFAIPYRRWSSYKVLKNS